MARNIVLKKIGLVLKDSEIDGEWVVTPFGTSAKADAPKNILEGGFRCNY
jgi:putative transposon-encoded protein